MDDHNSDTSPALHELSLDILMEILSYLPVRDYRDLANLRLISKNMQGVLPNIIKLIGSLDCSYGGTTQGFWDGIFGLVEQVDDDYKCNYSGLRLDFVNQNEQMKRLLRYTTTTDVADIRNKLSMFDGFELQDMMIVMAEGEWKQIEIDLDCFSSSTQNDHYQEFSMLCHEIVSTCTKSFQQCRTLAREAVKKGLFLPVESSQENGKSYYPKDPENIECQTHLIIATLSIPSENFKKQSIHRRDGENFYIQMISEEQQKKRQENPIPYLQEYATFSPRNQDLSQTFRAYPVENENEGTLIFKVPLTVCDQSEPGWNMLDSTEWVGEFLPAIEIVRFNQNKGIIEGVAIADSIIPQNLHQSLNLQIDALANLQTVVDYHPHSNNIVRDLVHPALYSFVKGISKVIKSEDEVGGCLWSGDQEPQKFKTKRVSIGPRNIQTVQYQEDYWGREYEASLKYQWLPTYFDIDAQGSCTICDYINNLVPREKFSDLYSSLELLFSHALPLLESTYTYGRKIRKYLRGSYRRGEEPNYGSRLYDVAYFKDGHCSLRGKKLQVITKIVDYELDDVKSYEGVWHVEGMSHEEIVATSIYVLERDEDLAGGDILFKRAIHGNEASFIENESSGQSRPRFIGKLGEDGEIPLGKIDMLKRRMVAFPNSHIHKVTKLEKKLSSTIIQDGENANDGEKVNEENGTKKKKNYS